MKQTIQLFIIAAAATFMSSCKPDLRVFSEGDRTGVVTKLSSRSTYEPPTIEAGCTNWEGELAMANTKISGSGSDVNGTGSVEISGGNTFEFSLPKASDDATYHTKFEDVLKSLHEAQKTGHRILLHYEQVASHDPCASRTDYLVVGVQDLDVPNRPVLGGRVEPMTLGQ